MSPAQIARDVDVRSLRQLLRPSRMDRARARAEAMRSLVAIGGLLIATAVGTAAIVLVAGVVFWRISAMVSG